MRRFIGITMVIFGLCLGVYVGLWKCFIMGIVGIIDALRTPESMTSLQVAISIVKVMFAGAFGWVAGLIPAFLGMIVLIDD